MRGAVEVGSVGAFTSRWPGRARERLVKDEAV